MVRCQSRSITFVLPTADGDPPPALIPTRWHSSLLPPHTMEEQGGRAPELCTAVTERTEIRQKPPGELTPGKTSFTCPRATTPAVDPFCREGWESSAMPPEQTPGAIPHTACVLWTRETPWTRTAMPRISSHRPHSAAFSASRSVLGVDSKRTPSIHCLNHFHPPNDGAYGSLGKSFTLLESLIIPICCTAQLHTPSTRNQDMQSAPALQ